MNNKIKVRVYHSGYGCDTGCCGHIVELTDSDRTVGLFEFTHPRMENMEDVRKWATELARKSIQKEFPSCLDSIDWDSLEFAEVSYD